MISVTDFRTGETTNYNPLIEMITPGPFQMSGHNEGGYFELIKAFLRTVRSGDASQITTGVDVSLGKKWFISIKLAFILSLCFVFLQRRMPSFLQQRNPEKLERLWMWEIS